MAYDNDILERMNMGNKQAIMYSCVADGATGTVVTGLKAVDAVSMTPKSLTTAAIKVVMNEGVAGTSAAGTIAVTGAASGDEFYMLVFGH